MITFSTGPEHVRTVMDALKAVPVFDIGDLIGTRLPVVLEASDGATARDWHNWVESLPGVVCVDVAFVSFEEPECREPGSRNSSETCGRNTASEADAPPVVQFLPDME
ncbi:MAG: hypothetical protein RIK87_14030 [Fuerstiella sp.]